MNLTHITSQSLRRLLSLTDKKEQLLKSIEEVENEIKKALTGAQAAVVEAVTPAKARKKKSRKTKAINQSRQAGRVEGAGSRTS